MSEITALNEALFFSGTQEGGVDKASRVIVGVAEISDVLLKHSSKVLYDISSSSTHLPNPSH